MSVVRRVLGPLLVCWLLSVQTARADPSRVRVSRGDEADPVVRQATTRLEAELRAAGFAVDREDAAAAGDPRPAPETGSPPWFASIAIWRNGSEAVADVRVTDHLSGKTLRRRVGAGAEPGTDRARTLAIRAVELLRASLLELRPPSVEETAQPAPEKIGPVAVPPRLEPVQVPRPPLAGWRVALGAATTWTAGFGPTIGPGAWVSRALAPGWVVEARWVGPTFGPTLRGASATVTLRQMILLAEVRRVIGRGRAAPLVTVGVGAVDSQASGKASAPLQGHDVQRLSAALHASLGLQVRLTKRVGLVAETGALLLAPARPVRVVEDTVGNASPWTWVSSVGLVTSFD